MSAFTSTLSEDQTSHATLAAEQVTRLNEYEHQDAEHWHGAMVRPPAKTYMLTVYVSFKYCQRCDGSGIMSGTWVECKGRNDCGQKTPRLGCVSCHGRGMRSSDWYASLVQIHHTLTSPTVRNVRGLGWNPFSQKSALGAGAQEGRSRHAMLRVVCLKDGVRNVTARSAMERVGFWTNGKIWHADWYGKRLTCLYSTPCTVCQWILFTAWHWIFGTNLSKTFSLQLRRAATKCSTHSRHVFDVDEGDVQSDGFHMRV